MNWKSYFRTSFSLLIVLLISNISLAQKESENIALQIIPDEPEATIIQSDMRINQVTDVPVALYKPNYPVNADSPENMAKQFLTENHEIFKLSNNLSELKYLNTRETPGGYHVHFDQYIGDYPVLNSRINVTISKDYRVVFVMNGSKINYNNKVVNNLERIDISSQQALISAKNYLGIKGSVVLEKSTPGIYYNKGIFRLAQVVTVIPAEDRFGEWQILVDAQTGEIFRVEDKACYFNHKLNNPTMIDGTGYVFDPDPITHARTTYGSTGFSDNNDADSDSLTAHRELRNLYDISFEGGIYVLKGPWAEIRDFESPYTGLHTNPTNDFLFTRNNDNFEAVNTYFHIDNSMRWINTSLGFTLTPYQYVGGVRFDPHGLSGADNSHYLTGTGSIAYGDGGVDDAEDLGVVLHELGHGIHDWLTNGSLSQVEGLSEGCGDYWTTSYIRSTGYWSPSDPAYNWVFIWDGHNPFWPGRITNYTAHYPEGLTGTIHTDGQMWASSLMSIYDLIGRTSTDSDFLEALSMTNGSSGQVDAANAFIAADQLLYAGSHLAQIIPVFADRGYIEGPITADFSANITSGQAPLSVQFTDLSIAQPGPITSWEWDFDNDGIIDATVQNPTWIYNDFGIYTVVLTVSDGTNSDSETKIDYITVTDPNQVTDTLFCEAFEGGLGGWTITNDGGTSGCVWEIRFAPFPNTYTLPNTSTGGIMTADIDECGGTSGTLLLSTATLNQTVDCSIYDVVTLEFDNDWNVIDAQDEAHIEVSNDAGTTWIGVWDQIGVDIRNTHESVNISAIAAGNPNVLVRLRSVQPGWDWWWVIDNFCIYGTYVVPVELTSFNAQVIKNGIQLQWSTSTETNNQGFEIERNVAGGAFEQVGYVAGFGTTTEPKAYTFRDINLEAGIYSYRLKQIDYNGSYEYSDQINVDYTLPLEYGLEQNYPNPFNPNTTIKYSIAENGLVKLAVYNMLGEEVAIIVNTIQKAGRYEVNFNASNLASGVYIYRLESFNFIAVKKLMLMK